jgi:hypothetical protein
VDVSSFACMEADEYAAWQEANLRTAGSYRAADPCSDCAAEYRRQQERVGRCVAHVHGAVGLTGAAPAVALSPAGAALLSDG